MAIRFGGAYFDKAITPVAFSLWMKTTSATVNVAVAGQTDSSSATRGWTLILNNTSNKLSLYGRDASADRFLFSNSVTVNDGTWHHVAVNFNFANGGTNKLWVDNTSASANASGAWGGTTFGFTIGKSPDNFWPVYPGDMAEIAAFSSQLTTDEVAALKQGYSPKSVAPGKLSAYLPMVREFFDIMGGSSIHNSGSETAQDHPRVIY